MEEKPRGKLTDLAMVASVGLEMGVAVAVGYFVGAWLDRKFDTAPWLMLLFLICGIIAGFRGLFRAGRAMRHAAAAKHPSDTP